MRNSLQPYEALSETIDYRLNEDMDEGYPIYIENNKEKFGTTDEWIDFDPLIGRALNLLGCTSYAYTRGDSLNWIETTIIQPSVEYLLKSCKEIEKQNRKGREFFWGGSGNNSHENSRMVLTKNDAFSVFTLIAWLLCFDIEEKNMQAIIPFIAPEGIDPLVDSILKRYQPGRIIGHSNEIEKIYTKPVFECWHKIGNSTGKEQVSLIHTYLDDWALLLSQKAKGSGEITGMYSLGLIIGAAHKSNKTLSKEIEGKKYPSYNGHWAWEVALFVKFFNIDDSSFRDHPLYPVEMVDYKKESSVTNISNIKNT